MLNQHVASGINHLDSTIGRDFEGLVMGAVFLSLLCHEADIGNSAHGAGIEGPVSAAIINHRLVHACVGGIGNNSQRILLFTSGVPHVTGRPDHGWHGSIHNHIGRNMQVGDAFIRVDHGQRWALGQGLIKRGFDFGTVIEGIQAGINGGQAVLAIQTSRVQLVTVLIKHISKISAHHMAEQHRIGHLHHGGLQVCGEQHTLFLSACNLRS